MLPFDADADRRAEMQELSDLTLSAKIGKGRHETASRPARAPMQPIPMIKDRGDVPGCPAINSNRFITISIDEPCRAQGGCTGYGDRWDGYPDCDWCGGSGTRHTIEWRTIGYLWQNLYLALCLERAFHEGHSAGFTDGRRRK